MRWLPSLARAGLLAFLVLSTSVAAQAPEQVHVTLGAYAADEDRQPMDASHLVVQWTVPEPYTPLQQPVVAYRIDDGDEETTAGWLVDTVRAGPATASQLRAFYAARIPAGIGQTATYRVGTDGALGDERTVAALPPDPRTPVRLAALGNTYYDGFDTATGERIAGERSPTEEAVSYLAEAGIDLVLHTGGVASSGIDMTSWDIVLRTLEPLASTVPVMPGPNAADATGDTYGDYVQYGARFVVPGITTGTIVGQDQTTAEDSLAALDDERLFYYGFSAGSAYIIVLNTPDLCVPIGATPPLVNMEAVIAVAPCAEGQPNWEQLAWLHDTLEDAREDLRASWIIVVAPDGPYDFSDDGGNLVARDLVVPLLESYNVDLVLSSTESTYARSFPLWGGLPTTRETNQYQAGSGPVYVTTAGAGRPTNGPVSEGWPPWLAASTPEDVYHVTLLDITNETLSLTAVDLPNGTTLDAFTIHRSESDGHADAAGPGGLATQSAPGAGLFMAAAAVAAALVARRQRA